MWEGGGEEPHPDPPDAQVAHRLVHGHLVGAGGQGALGHVMIALTPMTAIFRGLANFAPLHTVFLPLTPLGCLFPLFGLLVLAKVLPPSLGRITNKIRVRPLGRAPHCGKMGSECLLLRPEGHEVNVTTFLLQIFL